MPNCGVQLVKNTPEYQQKRNLRKKTSKQQPGEGEKPRKNSSKEPSHQKGGHEKPRKKRTKEKTSRQPKKRPEQPPLRSLKTKFQVTEKVGKTPVHLQDEPRSSNLQQKEARWSAEMIRGKREYKAGEMKTAKELPPVPVLPPSRNKFPPPPVNIPANIGAPSNILTPLPTAPPPRGPPSVQSLQVPPSLRTARDSLNSLKVPRMPLLPPSRSLGLNVDEILRLGATMDRYGCAQQKKESFDWIARNRTQLQQDPQETSNYLLVALGDVEVDKKLAGQSLDELHRAGRLTTQELEQLRRTVETTPPPLVVGFFAYLIHSGAEFYRRQKGPAG